MVCEVTLKPRQTLSERAEEVRRAVLGLDAALRMGGVRAVVGPQGAITFAGWNNERDGVTDACAYRRIMATGSSMAKHAIARAEALAGRTVDRATLSTGLHSHDGGKSWSKH
jgi:hypothetical protein